MLANKWSIAFMFSITGEKRSLAERYLNSLLCVMLIVVTFQAMAEWIDGDIREVAELEQNLANHILIESSIDVTHKKLISFWRGEG
ncbi:hypothetical protein ACK35E_00255 [Aeromonas veronii]|uniref:hypothetical protein n=1 Tax=unclassified Aeromonas TaxID=257493 RepID=UPI003A17F231